jgi:hypothetical protein
MEASMAWNRLLKNRRFRNFSFCFLFSSFSSAMANGLDAEMIGAIIGAQPTVTADGVVKVSRGRTDVPVQVDGAQLKPFAGLSSWAAFTATPDGAMLMGDTVVFQDEVNAAIDTALASGIEVTGLHNHFFYDKPKVYFMHVGGHGNPETLATAVKAVWDAIQAVRTKNAVPAENFGGPAIPAGTVNPASLETIVGQTAQSQDGMVKFTIGREGAMHGVKVTGSMGLTTWAALSGSDQLAFMDGDFIMTADEVQTVLKSLQSSGLNIVALHNHMVGEKPAFYFVHFWGKGSAADLARGFKKALDAQKPGL